MDCCTGVGISISSDSGGVAVIFGILVAIAEGDRGGRVVGIGVWVGAGVKAVGCDVAKGVAIGLGS